MNDSPGAEPIRAPSPEGTPFRRLGYAGVRLSVLKDKAQAAVSPVRLVSIGWPNQFMVKEIIEREGKRFLSLYPCCFWMIDRKSGNWLCKCHPAEIFEPLENPEVHPPGTPRRPGDRQAWINTPFGPLADLDFQDDPETPILTIRIGGLPIEIGASGARELAKVLKGVGF